MKRILIFIIFLIFMISGSRIANNLLIENGYNSYNTILLVKGIFKIVLAIVSFLLIKKWKLVELAGLSNIKLQKWWLLLFPALYLMLLNFSDEIPENITILNVIMLIFYCITISLGEELSLRGVLQPLLIKHFGTDKKQVLKAVFVGAFIFGIIHLIKFDKGIYGELSQVFFATFIGFCFGVLVLVIKRLYPLIIAHTLIDFFAKTDTLGHNFQIQNAVPTSLEIAILNILIVLPVFIYEYVIFKKFYIAKNELNEY